MMQHSHGIVSDKDVLHRRFKIPSWR